MAPPLGERTNSAPAAARLPGKPVPAHDGKRLPTSTPAPAAEEQPAAQGTPDGASAASCSTAVVGSPGVFMVPRLPLAERLHGASLAGGAGGQGPPPRQLGAEGSRGPAAAGTSAALDSGRLASHLDSGRLSVYTGPPTAPSTARSAAPTSGASSALGSPLAAFAAAKARLMRSNRDADTLLASTLAALGSLHSHTAAARASAAADACQWEASAGERSAGSSRASTPRRSPLGGRPLSAAGSMASTPRGGAGGGVGGATAGATLSAVAALHHRNLRLRERMSSTMALCHSLNEQNSESMQKVAQLSADKRRVSQSLRDARFDKDAVQQTIRQLASEAAQLAEQARRAWQPGSSASDGRPPSGGSVRLPGGSAAEAPARQQHAGEQQEQRSVEGQAEEQQEAQPANAREQHSPAAVACDPAVAAAREQLLAAPGDDLRTDVQWAAAGEQVFGGSASSAAGDKRRRLASASLVHGLGPAVAAAMQEADASEAGASFHSSSSSHCRLPTPSDTPKRKVRALGSKHEASIVPPAACDPAAEPPGALASAALEPVASAADEAQPLPLVEAAMAAAQPSLGAASDCDQELEWETFLLFDRKWYGGAAGGAGSSGADGRLRSGLRAWAGPDGGCLLM